MTCRDGLQCDFFDPSGPPALSGWEPHHWAVAPDWRPLVDGFFGSLSGRDLGQFVTGRLATGAVIYPPLPLPLRALALTPLSKVKVVIIGQDPYHGPGQAEGLAFSVAPGIAVPPSLRNIFKELAREAAVDHAARVQTHRPADGSLVRWALQGVLLLNTCLTVEQGQPASHANHGWEVLTHEIVNAVLANERPVVFMLWGAYAQKMAQQVRAAAGRHCVLCANHPSPLSASRPPLPFIGCGHFGKANAFLQESGETAVDW